MNGQPKNFESQAEQFEFLKKELEILGGKIFISFVHPHFYGPMRNLNFILETSDPRGLENYLLSGWEKIVTDIWAETMMSTVPMVMPWEMTITSEIKPPVVKTIQEGEDYIRKMLKKNKTKEGYGPFYYRLGTH